MSNPADDHYLLYQTLERINLWYGNGDILEINFDTSKVLIKRTSQSPQWYTYRLLDNGRVRFRGTVRSLGFKIR